MPKLRLTCSHPKSIDTSFPYSRRYVSTQETYAGSRSANFAGLILRGFPAFLYMREARELLADHHWLYSFCSTSFFCPAGQLESNRKIVNRVVATYPELALAVNLRGSVGVHALVAQNGNVRSVQVRGGHPLLA